MLSIPIALLVSGALLTGEAISRINHVTDFPVYVANNTIGYMPAPNQHGSFRNRGEWAFNDRSMGTRQNFAPSSKEDILLMGDSIVFGRLTITEENRLGGRLEKVSGKKVWPISAGSWALQNEMQYLKDNPDVLRSVDRLVLILNSNDFGVPSSWRSEAHRPTKRPLSAFMYWITSKASRRLPKPPKDMLVRPQDPIEEFKSILATTNIPVDVWLYPKKAELDDPLPLEEHGADLDKALADRVRIFHVADIPDWSPKAYADRIHPNGHGDALLARAIAKSFQTTLRN